MHNFSIAVQILPKSKDSKGIISVVDSVIDYISSYEVNYVVGPFETVIEGDYETLMAILRGITDFLIDNSVDGYLAYVKMNYGKDGVMTIDEKTSKFKK